MTIKEKLKISLKTIFKKNKIVKINNLKLGSFKEWDSLNHFNFLLQVEKDFKIKFSTKDFSTIKSLKQIIEVLNKKIAK
jgi:acyl carrier protein